MDGELQGSVVSAKQEIQKLDNSKGNTTETEIKIKKKTVVSLFLVHNSLFFYSNSPARNQLSAVHFSPGT